MNEIVSLVITVAILLVCIVCAVFTCLVCCNSCLCQACVTIHHQRHTENQSKQEDDETNEPKGGNLSEAPPPSYKHAEEYQNVDLEHAEVVRLKQSTYKLSSHVELEEVSLPPDYTSNRGDHDMSVRMSVAAPQQTQVKDGQLPPTYSTAQLELMARRTATEQNFPSSSNR